MPFHRIEDVTNSLREDLRRPSSDRGPQGDEDGLLTRDRSIDRRGIEDVTQDDPHRIPWRVQAGGVAYDRGHDMAGGDGPLDKEASRLTGGPEDDHVHGSAPTRS
jgi:hypothetical protein